MRLAEVVSPDRILIPLDAGAPGERAGSLNAAADVLLDRLVATAVVSEPDRLRKRIEEQRGEDIVSLGGRAFITHCRSDAVRELALAIGVAAVPVRRVLSEHEAQTARIVLMLLAPPRMAARYLQILGAFARLLSDQTVVEQMESAGSAEALAALPVLQSYELPQQLAVRDIMTERPRTTTPDAPLRDAARDMARAGINELPVVDADGLLLGVLSEQELMRYLVTSYLQGTRPHRPLGAGNTRRTVRDVMTRKVLAVSPDQPLAELASLMTNKDVAGVPVVRDGRLVGFLTRGDIVRKLIGF